MKPLRNSPDDSNLKNIGVTDPLQHLKMAPQILAMTSGSLAVLIAGFHVGWPSPTLVHLLADDSDIPVTSSQGAWIVGCYFIGGITGAVLNSILVDRWGRRRLIVLNFVPNVIGFTIIALARSYWHFYVARIICGIATGLTMHVMPMYLGEITNNKLRSTAGPMFSNMTNFGVLMVYCVGPWVDRITLACIGGVLSVSFALIFFWMPESPYYLVMKKQTAAAIDSLAWLKRSKYVNEELNFIEQTVKHDQWNAGGYKDLVSTHGNRTALVVGIILVLAQELSGIMPILAYSQLIFATSGVKSSPRISSIVVAGMQFAMGLCFSYIAYRARRRTLLLISALGSFTFLCCEALYFQLKNDGVNMESIFWLPATGIVGYIASFSIGLGPLTWTMFSEIFPCNVKAPATMISVVATIVASLSATQIYQRVTDDYGIEYSFWLFAAITFFFTIVIYFVVPETKNKSFREIQDVMRLHFRFQTNSERKSRQPVPSQPKDESEDVE